MKYFIAIILVTCAIAAPIQFSFNSGELSPLLKYRVDLKKRTDGMETAENVLVKVQGEIDRRPGTEFISQAPGTIFIGEGTPAYPILRAIPSDDIPTIPATPASTALSNEISVTTEQDLIDISNDLTAHYSIDGDITLVAAWTPLGTFTGIIEGNNNTISDLTINSASADNQGFISRLGTDAEIRNLTFDNASITADDRLGVLAGRIDEQQDILIKNVSITSSSVTGDNQVGGLIGDYFTDGGIDIFDCDATDVTIEGDQDVGGLIGGMDITGVQTSANNVVRCNTDGTSTITGEIGVGGLIGRCQSSSSVNDMVIHTSFSGSDVSIVVSDSSSVSWVGGFCGAFSGSNVTTCFSEADVSVTVTGNSVIEFVGGFAGELTSGFSYIDCYSTGSVSCTGDEGVLTLTGGFAGKFHSRNAEQVIVLGCYSTGAVDITLGSSVRVLSEIGGLTGAFFGPTNVGSDRGSVKKCYTTSQITTNFLSATTNVSGIGGFVGGFKGFSPEVENCYTWSKISSDAAGTSPHYVGGFISAAETAFQLNDITFTNCYSAQTLTKFGSGFTEGLFDAGTSQVGGFAGNDLHGTFDILAVDCFWDETTSSITADASVTATGHTTAFMQSKPTFEDAGWDMDDIWVMPDITAETVDVNDAKRLIPFEFSTDDSYILAFAKNSIAFFRTVK